MPTQTFFNLPKDKRIRILKSAKKEFSRVPLKKAIIANIAKDADIPRGSFYQYFTSVEDLYVYLVEYLYGINKKKFEVFLEENNNNIYDALKQRFSNEIDKLCKEENRQFRKNTISLLLDDNKLYSQSLINHVMDKNTQLDMDYFPDDVKNQKDFDKFIELVKGLNDFCVKKFLSNESNDAQIKEYYNNYIDFLKYNISLI